MTAPLPRLALRIMNSEAHGGPDHAELARLGLRPEDILDFSVSTNAYGPPPAVATAITAAFATAEVTRYPDRDATALRRALADRMDVAAEQVLVGNGAAELIWLIALAYLRPGDTAFVIGPTFGEYRAASQVMGVQASEWRASADDDFAIHEEAVMAALRQAQPRVVWLCNPNNPTGTYLGPDAWTRLRAAAPDALWVIDEAYRPFLDDPWPSPFPIEEGVVLLRSLTKDCALAGLRLGYALGAASTIQALAAAQPPWSVNSLAQAAGVAAVNDYTHVARTTAELRAQALALGQALRQRGWRVVPSTTHFMLVEVGDAASVRACLLREHHIQVRDCASFGLPQFIRVAARRPDENARLVAALGEASPREQ
jgi:histidinol-phosphate aminotransferase